MNRKHSLASLALAALVFSAAGAATASVDVQPRIVKATDVTEVTAYRHVDTIAIYKPAGSPLQLTAADEAATLALQIADLNRADQYELHQLARNRPEVTPQWRLVSSV
jgi:hypothetical protein